MKRLTRNTHRHSQGFSLVEVTIALGIAAFGITTILGLLPQGLNNLRTAGDLTSSSRISQHILGSLDQAQTLAANTKQRYYFDAYAVPIEDNAKNKGDIAFVAEVSPPAADVQLPGSKRDNDAYLSRVIVKLKQTPSADFDFDSASPSSFKLYSFVVAKTGK
jgi:uncharacterized protein (TIGR02598 family)